MVAIRYGYSYLSRLCLVYTNSHHNFVTIFKQIGSACRETCNSSASYYDSSFLYQTNTHCLSSLLLSQYSVYTSENSTDTLLRWTIDANVLFLRDYCHLSLFLFSLVVLVLLIAPYTVFLLTITLVEKPFLKYCKFSMYTKPFFDAYGGPYWISINFGLDFYYLFV